MRAPDFWSRQGGLGALLAPLGALYALGGATRDAFVRPVRASVPVFCAGNLTLGGAGKTPTVAWLAARLAARGRAPAILSRGYGGTATGPLRVDPARHGYRDVGDEALLLARAAPVYVGADRVASASRAVADGADVLVMDDGFQNPTLAKDLSLLVVDGAAGFGNGRVFPAGPLREPVARGAARAQAVLLYGDDTHKAAASTGLPVLRADLVSAASGFAGSRVFAFAGIGRPAKFFATLAASGAEVAATREFADHHPYSRAEIEALLAQAARLGARAVTTEKDHVRVPADLATRVETLPVAMLAHDEAAFDALVDRGLA
jgi:tetraacyldisaccharide 4'-kinase